MNRFEFIKGSIGTIATMGGMTSPLRVFASDSNRRLLRLGVLSDVHIGPDGSDDILLKELAYMDSQKVEVVVFPGDLTNSGLISEMERFASCWERIFPNGKASDGRKVEQIVVTGNHDLACNKAWEDVKWSKWTRKRQDEGRFFWNGNNERIWKKLFGLDWAKVWRREVKGVVFVCAQYGNYNEQLQVCPEIEKYFLDHAADFSDGKPFFFVQHAHPKGTCYAELAVEDGASDNGTATRALSPFPNAIALTGHSHIPLTEERSVWQGRFTSIGCGCAGTVEPTSRGGSNRQPCTEIFNPQASRAGLVIDLYCDRMVIDRRSFFYDEPVGPNWVVPLPSKDDGPYDFSRKAKESGLPQFPQGAEMAVAQTAKGWRIVWPQAKAGGRVFDYVVKAYAGGKALFERKVLSPDYHIPAYRAFRDGALMVEQKDFLSYRRIKISVVPRNCYYGEGRPLVADLDV